MVEKTLVEEGDVVGLAKALKRYIDDPALRVEKGMRNQHIVKTKFSACYILVR